MVLPVYITEAEPFRPTLLVWVEVSTGFVVAHRMLDRSGQGSLGELLREAMQSPLVGPPRRTERVRVASDALAAEVRAELDGSIALEVAATPEIDVLVAGMLEAAPEHGVPPSYLEEGRVPADVVADLFDAAARLYRAAPWRFASDDQVLALDIPALGLEGARVSSMGALEQTFGLAIFASQDAYENFRSAAQDFAFDPPEESEALDLGAEEWVLLFEPKAELPAEMRREIQAHRWRVAGPRAYPVVQRVLRDAVPRPLEARDVRIVAACAGALAVFARAHRGDFEQPGSAPVEQTYREGGVEVCLALLPPPEREGLVLDSDVLDPPLVAPVERVGRNDPCPCGSGKKYKKCHLTAERASSAPRPPLKHGVDEEKLFVDVCRYGHERFPSVLDVAWEPFGDPENAQQLAGPWIAFGPHVEERSIAELYLEARGRRLAPAERTWLERQCAAWLSLWEVTGIEPGVWLALCDLLTGETRRVREVSGSRGIGLREAILARVVDHEDASVLDGTHPRALPPRAAAELVRELRADLRLRKKVAVAELRGRGSHAS